MENLIAKDKVKRKHGLTQQKHIYLDEFFPSKYTGKELRKKLKTGEIKRDKLGYYFYDKSFS